MSVVNGLPKIVINYQVYNKMRAYADVCRDEISALGTVKISDNVIYINDIFLFNQTVTPSSTEINADDLSRFVYECITTGADPSSLKLWWHSHVNMDVFWSNTDLNTIGKFSKEWMVSIVSNKHDKFKVRLDIFNPIRICLDDLPYTVEYDKTYNPLIRQEVNAKVHTSFFTDLVRGDRGNFFGCDEDFKDQRSFIPMPGDPKTVVMTEPPLRVTEPKSPAKSTVPRYVVKKSIITKLWEFFVGEARFTSIEINKVKPIAPVRAPVPIVSIQPEPTKETPPTGVEKP